MAMSNDGSIAARLWDSDGRDTAVLESILVRLDSSPGVADELLALVASERSGTSIGATWLLKALLEEGLSLDASRVATLARSLFSIDDAWARLHVCQSMRYLDVPGRNRGQFARFLERCAQSEQKFLRAWALDGWWRLAQQHERYLPRALAVLECAEKDTAASVRARARHVRREVTRSG